jgi:hypothetical protein
MELQGVHSGEQVIAGFFLLPGLICHDGFFALFSVFILPEAKSPVQSLCHYLLTDLYYLIILWRKLGKTELFDTATDSKSDTSDQYGTDNGYDSDSGTENNSSRK